MTTQTHDWIKTTANRPLLIVYARLATTANVNLTTDVEAGSTIDGVTVAAGDVLLIKDHATGATKGLYVAPAAAGTAVRHHLMPVGAEVHGVCVRVLEGTANGNKTFWCQAAEGAATVGTDALTFAVDDDGGISDGDTLATGVTFPNTGLHILDTNASHDLIIAPGSDLTADRTLTVTTGDADRTLTLSGNTTLGGGSHSGTNTGDETAAGILAKLVTVDGAGSGLDADLLDGQSSAAFLAAANNLSDVANAATARTNLGLGSLATVTPTGTPDGTKFLRDDNAWAVPAGGSSLPVADTTAVVKGSGDATKLVRIEADGITTGTTRVITMPDQDVNLTPNTGTFPAATHASRHQSGGADAIKLDDLATPDDNTDLNASTSRHGLLPKLGGGTTNFLRADGSWAAPPGAGGEVLFDITDPNNGTAANIGSPTVTTGTNGMLSTAHGSASTITGRGWTAPSTPYTITMLLLPKLAYSTYPHIGMILRDSSGGKLYTFGWGTDSTQVYFQILAWDNLTTYNSTVWYETWGGIHPMFLGPVFLRYKDDGTNRSFYWSRDGLNFGDALYSEGRTTFFTANQYGFGGDQGGSVAVSLGCRSVVVS